MNVHINLNEGLDDVLNRLDKLLENGIVKFMYMKKDGSYRKAIGTRNNDIISQLTNGSKSLDKSDNTNYSDTIKGLERYFDIERNCVRTYYRTATLACDLDNIDINNFNLEDLDYE